MSENKEWDLLNKLAEGMKVHLPEGMNLQVEFDGDQIEINYPPGSPGQLYNAVLEGEIVSDLLFGNGSMEQPFTTSKDKKRELAFIAAQTRANQKGKSVYALPSKDDDSQMLYMYSVDPEM